MITEIISPDTTMMQSRAEREVYPEVQTYVDLAAMNLIPLMRVTEKKPKKDSWFSRSWMPPQPRPQLRDNHQLVLMIEAAVSRALVRGGFRIQEILPAGEQFGYTIYWS